MTDAVAVIGWLVAVAVGLVGAARRYRWLPGIDRQRLQWIAAGAVASVEFGLVVVGLYLLVRWPIHPWAIAAGGTRAGADRGGRCLLPAPAGGRRTGSWCGSCHGDRTLGGGAGRLRTGHPGLRSRARLPGTVRCSDCPSWPPPSWPSARRSPISGSSSFAQRLVYGTDDVPDDVVKTFSTRLTRAVTMDELLLQLTESLHKSMVLTSAEVFTGSSEVLERTASIPDRGPSTLHIGPQEQPVVARAGVSGNAWTSVWLPAVIAGRDHAQLRVCPITYGGELLGLVVVERPTTEPPFTEQEDLVLTELSRQVGTGPPQRQSRLRPPVDPGRGPAAGRRAAGFADPHRGRGRRRATSGGT